MLSTSEQELVHLRKKAQHLEDEALTMAEEPEQHQAVHDWFIASGDPDECGGLPELELAELQILVQDLHKSAKEKVRKGTANWQNFISLKTL